MADTAGDPRQDASQQLDAGFIPDANEIIDRDVTHDSIDLPTNLGEGFLEGKTFTEALAQEDTDLTMGKAFNTRVLTPHPIFHIYN